MHLLKCEQRFPPSCQYFLGPVFFFEQPPWIIWSRIFKRVDLNKETRDILREFLARKETPAIRVIHDFGKVKTFESLLGEEAQNKKNEPLKGGHSMVSNGLFVRTF